jgi:hypothetical protein
MDLHYTDDDLAFRDRVRAFLDAELPSDHYFKRLSTIELSLGDGDHHLARFIAQPGFNGEEAA